MLRPPKIQQRRLRRACIGELVQIGGCEHYWFEDRAAPCTALVYIDDATSRLMHILFTGTDSTFGYFEAIRQYLERHGKPLASSNLTLHYERKLYLLPDTPENRRYATKYLDVYQFPDGKIEIRAAGVSLPYSAYDKLGAIDQGAIVENKRLGHSLRISNMVQAERDNRSVAGPSTAHRINGKKIPRKKLAGTKTQRELNRKDLQKALEVQS